MRSIPKYLILSLLWLSCSDSQEEKELPALLNSHPISASINLEDGYKINPLTGDSVLPIILNDGSTLKSGISQTIKGKRTFITESNQAEMVRLKSPKTLQSNPIPSIQIKGVPKKTIVKKEELVNIDLKQTDRKEAFILNRLGDTVKTGIMIPAIGREEKVSFPDFSEAKPLEYKDASRINLKFLDVDQGMISSYVYTLSQDRIGNIWMGTYSGVSSYNGSSFRHYTEEKVLSNNSVTAILEDSKGNLWFGTRGGGISRYDGLQITHYSEEDGFSNNYIWSIIEDASANIWFGTSGGGICKYTEKEDGTDHFTHYTTNEGLSHNEVLKLLEDKSGNIWIGTNGGGINRFDGQSFTHFGLEQGLSNLTVWSIEEDVNGHLWFGTNNGLNQFDGNSIAIYTEENGLSSNTVWSLCNGKPGELWIGTDGGGLNKFDGEQFTHFTEKQGLSNNSILSTMKDAAGNIWVGSWGGGVNVLHENSFTHLTEEEGLVDNSVLSILKDHDGKLWLGSRDDGITLIEKGQFKSITTEEGLKSNSVLSILEDRKGNIWLGTGGSGVAKYDGEYLFYYTDQQGLNSHSVWTTQEDRDGNIWMGTDGGGLSVFDGNSITNFSEEEGFSDDIVGKLIEDQKGNIWIGSNSGGLSMIKAGSFSNGKAEFIHLTEREGLAKSSVWSLLEDSFGNIWIGTNGKGISVYDGESFTYITEKEGLNNNFIWSIIEDSSQTIWVSTENGLNELKKLPSNHSLNNENTLHTSFGEYAVYSYNKADGLMGSSFNNCVYIDQDENIWWGGGKSLSRLDLKSHQTSSSAPKVALKQIEIGDDFIDFQHLNTAEHDYMNIGGIKTFENYPLDLELPYTKRHLSFHFAATDWHAPQKVKYSYQLLGLNNGWSQPSFETKAEYRNLPYGKNTFRVMAIGESGEWSKAIEYEFIIHPPWWQSWWAKTLYVLLALVAIRVFIRWRTNNLRRRQEELKIEVENATKEIKAQKEEVERQKDQLLKTQSQLIQSEKMASLGMLTAGVAHEINNPNNFIASGVEGLKMNIEDLTRLIQLYEQVEKGEIEPKVIEEFKEEIEYDELLEGNTEVLSDIQEGSKRITDIVKSLRSFNDSNRAGKELMDLNELIDSTLRLLKHMIPDQMEIIKEYDDSIPEIKANKGELGQVLTNLIANAIQAIEEKGKEKGKIIIQTKYKEFIEIHILDNGSGMNEEVKKHLFDPFFTTKKVGDGQGLGLYTSLNIIQQHGGSIIVNSQLGEGTEFTIELPLDR